MQHDYTDMPIDTAECAQRLGHAYNLDADRLLFEPEALVEATARWHIRGDADTVALHWLTELVAWQRVSSGRISALAARIVEDELLPCVEALCSSTAIRTLEA